MPSVSEQRTDGRRAHHGRHRGPRRKRSGRYTGTVVRRAGGSIFVAWHGTVVEDELGADEVEMIRDAEVIGEVRG